MPTIGWFSGWPPIEPWNWAFAEGEEPAVGATSQYPPASAVAAMPTTGLFRVMEPVDPQKGRFPKAKIPPSEADM